MPSTTDAKLFAVAKALAEGETVKEAMLAAGYGYSTVKQERIRWTDAGGKRRFTSPRNHPVVAAHLAEMRAKASNRAAVTIASITDELEEARALATEERNAGAMVQASLGKAKLHGLLVTKMLDPSHPQPLTRNLSPPPTSIQTALLQSSSGLVNSLRWMG